MIAGSRRFSGAFRVPSLARLSIWTRKNASAIAGGLKRTSSDGWSAFERKLIDQGCRSGHGYAAPEDEHWPASAFQHFGAAQLLSVRSQTGRCPTGAFSRQGFLQRAIVEKRSISCKRGVWFRTSWFMTLWFMSWAPRADARPSLYNPAVLENRRNKVF